MESNIMYYHKAQDGLTLDQQINFMAYLIGSLSVDTNAELWVETIDRVKNMWFSDTK